MKKSLIIILIVLVGAWFIFINRSTEQNEDVLLPETEEQENTEDETGENQVNENSEIQNKLSANTWVWVETIMSKDGQESAPNNPGDFTLTFDGAGRVSGTTDCNNFFGPYELDGTSIETGPLASTLMYCEGSQEQAFTNMISEANLIFFDENDNLVLLYPYDSGSIIFEAK